jgi:gliding motility-associated-like protein
LTIFPGLYCADTAFTKVLVYPFLQSSFTYQDSCEGQPVEFTSTSRSTGGVINYTRWSILDKTELDSSDAPTLSYRFTKAPQTYRVLLTVGTDRGCLSTDSQYVNIWPAPFPLASHDSILSAGATLQLQANDGNSNFNGQFLWYPAEGLNDPTSPDPVVNGVKETTYYVSIKNAYGCSPIDSIHIIYYTGPDIYVPNAFTPNGDGRNDIFRPVPVGITAFKYFRVFSRYGEILFESTQPNEGWNGTINGKPAAAGVYVWETAGVDYNKKLIIRKGTVMLIR